MKLPDNKFKIIYADPPWSYNQRWSLKHHKTRFGGGACNYYKLMTTDQICNLNVSDIADDNCVLFLWVTFPRLQESFRVMEAWGFTYKTVGFTWIKTNKNDGRPFFGVGFYTKSNAEVCLLGTKGKMKPISNSVSSAIISPRQEHSRKPDEVRDRIVQLYGDVPRIELFARQKTKGWEVWGNNITN